MNYLNLILPLSLSFLIIFDAVISYDGITINKKCIELNPLMIKIVNDYKLLTLNVLFLLLIIWGLYFTNYDYVYVWCFTVVSIFYGIAQYNNVYQILIKP